MKMKGITDVSAGTVEVKSARGSRVRSAPKSKSSSYLEIFTANVERIRLVQEQENLGKRQFQIEARMARNQKRLADIQTKMQSILQRTQERGGSGNRDFAVQRETAIKEVENRIVGLLALA